MALRRTARTWLIEIGLGIVAVLLGLFFRAEPAAEGDGVPLSVDVVSGAAAFLALVLFRRRYPVALTAVLIPFGIILAMPMGATPIALFTVALHRSARIAVTLTAVHAAAVIVLYRIAIPSFSDYLQVVGFLVFLHISLVAVAMLIRSQRLLVRSWAERAQQAEEGQRMRLEQARLAEREQIAREMHDVLAHRISLLAVHAGALEVSREARPADREAAGVIRQCAYDAVEDLRQVLGTLREKSAEDRPQPTLGDVPALVEQSRDAGARITLDRAERDPVPDMVGRHAYRIVQEALTNARKHAPGADVRVAVHGCAEEGLVVEVGNALVPAGRAIPGAGVGLVGLRERVQLAGGRLEHGPTAGGEFQLRAWLPWTP